MIPSLKVINKIPPIRSSSQSLNASLVESADYENENDPNLITEIERIDTTSKIPAITFWGVFIDPNLSFQYHITVSRSVIKFPVLSMLFVLQKMFFVTRCPQKLILCFISQSFNIRHSNLGKCCKQICKWNCFIAKEGHKDYL